MIKKEYLRRTLAKKLVDHMIFVEESDSYSDYCFQLCHISDCLQEMKETKRRFVKIPSTIYQSTTTDEMDWKSTKSQVSTAIQKATDMITRSYAKWISQKEIDKKKKNNDYFRYSLTDHHIANCSYSSAKRPAILVSSAKSKEKRTKKMKKTKTEKTHVKKISDSETTSDSENK